MNKTTTAKALNLFAETFDTLSAGLRKLAEDLPEDPVAKVESSVEGGMSISPDYQYDSKGAAKALNVPVATLKKWRQRKVGPLYHQFVNRGTCRYLGRDLIKFVETSKIEEVASARAAANQQ